MREKSLSITEFAAFIECSPNSAYKIVREKKVRSYMIGNRWRIPLEAAQAFIGGGGDAGQTELDKAA